MASLKYCIRASEYPFKGYADYVYETKWFALFAVHYVWCIIRYPIVDTQFRASKRMDKQKVVEE